MVYGFAAQSGGYVDIQSKFGSGTTVSIVLPAAQTESDRNAGDNGETKPATGTGRVLVVEDEPQVLELISSHLSQLGYDVTAVSTGPEALAIFDKGAGFDLLLTDVVLPGGVSGLELVQRARDIDARVKVLLTSGYSKEVFHPHGGIDPALSILRKPYRRDDLAQQLRQIFYSKA